MIRNYEHRNMYISSATCLVLQLHFSPSPATLMATLPILHVSNMSIYMSSYETHCPRVQTHLKHKILGPN